MSWECKIRKVDNGYIFETDEVEVMEECASGEDYDRFKTTDDEKVAMAKLLHRVAEHFGENHSKWDSDNLVITFDGKGSKVE